MADNEKPLIRPSVAALDGILGEKFPILNHGFIRVVDYMGDDASVVQAARVSYGSGTKTTREDAALIRYLLRKRHTTPFEMCELKVHVKLPIFVARQWIRHRTASVNEYSARYSVLDSEFYVPSPQDLQLQSSTNKQGRSGQFSQEQAAAILNIIKQDAERSYSSYEYLLAGGDGSEVGRQDSSQPEAGLARELARIGLGVNFYTQWYWKTNLHNLMHFLSLRADAHAQKEIRVYADVLLDIVKKWVPSTHAAFLEYNLHGAHLSRSAVAALRAVVKEMDMNAATRFLSGRELREFYDLLDYTNNV